MTHPAGMIGLLAGSLTTVSFVPQVFRIWKTRSANDVSGLMFGIFSLGVFFWLVYGLCIHDIPIVITNGLTLALSCSVLGLKLRYAFRASLK
jgi:MtN3 and saliva related transmembrane protein